MLIKKIFIVLILSQAIIYSQLQHNYWYQVGPFGGNVTDISLSKNTSEIAVVTQAGAAAFNYDWLDVENGSSISNVEYYSSPNRQFLLVLKNNQLLSTFDYGYHWKLVFSVQDSLTGLSIGQASANPIYIWSDSIIFKGNLDSTQWDSIYPRLGKIISLLPDPNDSSIVYLGTSNGLYKSTDAGFSWNAFALIKKPINSISIAEVFPNIIYVSNAIDNYIYTSSDNGVSWDSSNIGLPSSIYTPIRALTCSPSVNGMAFAATNDGIYKTVNAGAVWFKFSNQLSFLDSGKIKTIEANTVKLKENKIYCGTSEGLFQADVLTDIWQQLGPYNEKVLSITKNIFNYDTQVVIGTPKGIKYQKYSAWSPSLLYSQTGPTISKVVSSHDYYNQFFLAATDNKNTKSIIYRSTDNGINWDTVFSLPNESCYVESFYQRPDSSNIIFILVSNQNSSYGLYRSEQSGAEGSWVQMESSYQKNFVSAANNSNADTLFFLIDNNQLYLSTDGGISITYLSTIPGDRFNYLYVSNRSNIDPIYAAGQGVKRSFDYLTWENFGLDTVEVIELTEDWSSLFAATRFNGVFSNFYYAGQWYPFNDGLGSYEITDIVNFTHSIMHVATANNSVYIMYSIINEADEEISELPESFELYQNYPNPFNPTTTIRYAIPLLRGDERGVSVKLKVYDVLGNEVATLVDEYREAGSYEVEFSAKGGSASGRDAKNLSSGIYFYQFQAGNFLDTKKMVLLR